MPAPILNKSSFFYDKSIQVIQASYYKDFLQREEKRMKEAENRLRVLWDDYYDLAAAWTQKLVDKDTWVNPETGNGLCKYVDISNNVYKAIINLLAMLYKNPPIREFTKSKGAKKSKIDDKEKKKIELENKKVEEIFNIAYGIKEQGGIKSSNLDLKFKKANRYVQAVNDVYLYFVWRNDKIDIDVLAPNNLIIIPKENDPTEPEVIMIKKSLDMLTMQQFNSDSQNYYIVWSAEEHYHLIETNGVWTKAPIGENEEMTNPYGLLPFVGIHKSDNDTLWNETEGEDLYQLGLWVAAMTTIWNQNWTWHNYKQLAIATNDEGKIPAGLGRAPDRAIIVPGDSEIEALDWSIDTGSLLEQIEKKASMIAANYGIDLKASLAEIEESGIKLRIRQSFLQEQRQNQVKTFTKTELESFEIIKTILSVEMEKPIDGEMEIKFADQDVYQGSGEQLDIIEKELKLDIESLVDVIQRRNPYLTREQAIEKIKTNIAENNEMRGLRDTSILDEIEDKND